VFVKRGTIRWLSGRDLIETYKARPPYRYDRSFCRICGTALGEISSEADSFPIAPNSLDSDPEVRNRFHEFVAEKPDWYEICDGAKQFDRHPGK
jgi:hypothetical protein